MAAWLQPELTTIALCWRLDRRDGVTLGFTSHDRDLEREGLAYRATPGMASSAVSLSDGFDVDTMDVTGALTSDAISESDLTSGRWDGAVARLFAVDWTAPEGEAVPLARGTLGDVGWRDGAFTAELRGATALLERPAVEQCSPECRAELGDRRCRVDLASRTHVSRVVAADEMTVRLDRVEPIGGAFGYGRVRWIEGANSGLASAVAGSAGDSLWLREAAAFPVEVGTLVEATEGCDKQFATCRDRFGNSLNFRGEPHLPGNDLLVRYPGA